MVAEATMERVEHYISLARESDGPTFLGQVPGHFLLKRPTPGASQRASPEIRFQTAFARFDVDPYAAQYVLLPVAKRAGNPYPDRISIGRATNCDIVLRVPFVSKIQAHILPQPDGSFAIRGNRAVNMTRLNARQLAPDTSHPLRLGDKVGFGPMEFEFIDAAGLYLALRSEIEGT